MLLIRQDCSTELRFAACWNMFRLSIVSGSGTIPAPANTTFRTHQKQKAFWERNIYDFLNRLRRLKPKTILPNRLMPATETPVNESSHACFEKNTIVDSDARACTTGAAVLGKTWTENVTIKSFRRFHGAAFGQVLSSDSNSKVMQQGCHRSHTSRCLCQKRALHKIIFFFTS